MRTNIEIDAALMANAMRILKVSSESEAVSQALRTVVTTPRGLLSIR